MEPATTPPPPPPRTDRWFPYAVGILGLTIVIALGSLWFTERRRRIRAEEALAKARRNPIPLPPGALEALAGSPGTGPEAAAGDLRRDEIAGMENVAWRGENRVLIRVRPEAGKRRGFEPGDLVEILPESNATTRTPGGG